MRDKFRKLPNILNILTALIFMMESGHGVIASATDSFIKTPIEIVAWATPESGAKDFLQELAGAWGDVSQALEDMSSNPKVFKVSKIGADVAGIVIGVGGTVKAITKTGQIVKVGKASQGLNYMISGGAAALARDVVFVSDGTALAGAAKSVTKGLLMATGSGKTGFEDLESLGEGCGESKPKAEPTTVEYAWKSWEDYEKICTGGQWYAKVGDRLYSRHAVDRTQPSGNRFGSSIVQAGGTTGRSVLPKYVEEVIKTIKPVAQEIGNLQYVSGTLEIIINQKVT